MYLEKTHSLPIVCNRGNVIGHWELNKSGTVKIKRYAGMVDGETCGLSEYTISVVQLVIDNSIKTNSGNDTLWISFWVRIFWHISKIPIKLLT